jgi:toxin CcdB
MAKFDVYLYSKDVPLVVDVQANLLSDLKTRVVVPLLPKAQAKQEALPKLKPVIKVKEKEYIFMATDIGTISLSGTGGLVANVEDQRQTIIDALDFLFQGF